MAAGLLSFGPGLVTKGHHRKNGIRLEARNKLVFVYQQDAKSASRFSGGDLFVTKGVTSRGLWFEGCFCSIVLSPMRRQPGFWSSYWYHSNRKKEIYNFGIVLGLQLSKGLSFQRITFSTRFCKRLIDLGPCFVTTEAPLRFYELRI